MEASRVARTDLTLVPDQPVKPLLQDDGTVSRDHWYLLFRNPREKREIVFAFPRVLLIRECIDTAQAMLGYEWAHIDLNDSTYSG